jgi:hypothetical protein
MRWAKRIPPQLKSKGYTYLLKVGSNLELLRLEESDNLLKNLAMQRVAIEIQDLTSISYLSGQVHKNLELVGRYLGEFAKHTVQTNISILVQPEYLRLRSALLQALWPFPEARQAVAAVLHSIEATAAQEPVQNGHDNAPALIDVQPVEARNG